MRESGGSTGPTILDIKQTVKVEDGEKARMSKHQFWFETKASSRPQQIPCRTSSSICCGNPRPQIAELGNYCSRFIPLSPTFISHLSDCATAMSDLCNDIVSIVFSLNRLWLPCSKMFEWEIDGTSPEGSGCFGEIKRGML